MSSLTPEPEVPNAGVITPLAGPRIAATERCAGCGGVFALTRSTRRYCASPCRVRALARRRAEELRGKLAALETLRAFLLTEIARWDAIGAGRRQRGGAD